MILSCQSGNSFLLRYPFTTIEMWALGHCLGSGHDEIRHPVSLTPALWKYILWWDSNILGSLQCLRSGFIGYCEQYHLANKDAAKKSLIANELGRWTFQTVQSAWCLLMAYQWCKSVNVQSAWQMRSLNRFPSALNFPHFHYQSNIMYLLHIILIFAKLKHYLQSKCPQHFYIQLQFSGVL